MPFEVLPQILRCAYEHKGELYGGFVRDFVARDFLMEQGICSDDTKVAYEWTPREAAFQPYDTKTFESDDGTNTETNSYYRFKDVDIWFPTEEAREAFIIDALRIQPRYDRLNSPDRDTTYFHNRVQLVGVFPLLDLLVGPEVSINDSPVNLLCYDGQSLYLNPRSSEELRDYKIPQILGLISQWTFPVVSNNFEIKQLMRYRRIFLRGWDLGYKTLIITSTKEWNATKPFSQNRIYDDLGDRLLARKIPLDR